MAETMWMVRAGEDGYLIEEFDRGCIIAIGWHKIGDLSAVTSEEEISELYDRAYPDAKPVKARLAVSMICRFRFILEKNEKIVTYNPQQREYFVGTITSDYYHNTDEISEAISNYAHLRRVDWLGRVSRDVLSVSSRNSLGSSLTLFSVNEEVSAELLSHIGKAATPESIEEDDSELDQIKEDTVTRAHELIKDKLLELSPDEMEELAAAILRAMGYKTRVMPKGRDRGVDVLASRDGLGLEEPRIKVEVKHRSGTSMGSQDIRSFLGGLREGEKALYISTGGFTQEAKYEADRSKIPLTLLELNDLADLIVTHYESFDIEGKRLMPLVRVYFPTE